MSRSGVISVGVFVVVVFLVVAAWVWWPAASPAPSSSHATDTVTVRRGAFARTIRVAGITEATRAAAAIAPRMAGQSTGTLVITRLVKSGSRVRAGDVLMEFDPQDQVRFAFDRRTEYQDLELQIRRLEAEQAAARASDETAVTRAENDVARAELEVRKNRHLPRNEAERNDLALEEARARLAQIRHARSLRPRTSAADMRIVEIRRERSERALRHAEGNTGLMVVRAPFDGLAVLQPVFKGSQMIEVQEGDEVRAGMPVVNVVDPSSMQVRARINQVDIASVRVGQRARVSLDAYPGVSLNGRVTQLAPLAITSSLTPTVRGFVAVITIEGSDTNLMPDLSAAVDIVVEQRDNCLLLPRDAISVAKEGTTVLLRRGGSFVRQPVSLGEVSAEHAVVTGGLREGSVVARRASGGH